MSLDFSQKIDLISLASVVSALNAVAQPVGIDYFLLGAAARDLMLRYGHDIEPSRLTEDVDFAVSVPFGGLENADRKISWPPDHHTVFDCFGAKEAFDASISVQLPHDVTLRVASIPALTLLKITAWEDRKHSHPGRDAGDLLLYARTYMDCGNMERATSEHGDLFSLDDFDYEYVGARLLGRDIASLLDKRSIEYILPILLPQADTDGPLLLSHQSGLDLERGRRLIEALCDGLADNL